jgi:uracil-DNA glycosylase family 4
MLKKPNSCFSNNCPLATKGCGYGPVDGPEAAKILVVGEALGKFEAIQGKPFVGQCFH